MTLDAAVPAEVRAKVGPQPTGSRVPITRPADRSVVYLVGDRPVRGLDYTDALLTPGARCRVLSLWDWAKERRARRAAECSGQTWRAA